MASGITLYQIPQAYMPVYNPQFWNASSIYTGQPNFNYEIVVTDVITSVSKTFRCAPKPDFSLTFNSESTTELFMKNFLPVNTYGFKKCTNAFRKIKVNIGERYDILGVSTYTAGTDKFYIVWNGVIDLLEWANYAMASYVYNSGVVTSTTPNLRYLTDLLPESVYEGRSNLFYAITSHSNEVQSLIIRTYDSAGAFIADSYIANPFTASGDYTEKYFCIDLGYKGLSNISGGLVTGAYPIITASVASWKVIDSSVLNNIYFPAVTLTDIKTYTLRSTPRYDVFTLHCLFRNGHYRTIHCNGNSERTASIVKSTAKQIPYVQESALADITVNYGVAVEQVLQSIITDKLKLNTDWLTEEESAIYKQAVFSSSIMIDLGTGQGYSNWKCTDGSYFTKKRYDAAGKIWQLCFQLEQTHDNHGQRS